VIKECGRRMAYFDDIKKKYVNVPGIAYLDDNAQKVYLCSTDPYEKVGMSKPIKIEKKIGEMTLEQIVEDIYHLSFMNIHTDRKVHLPVTTNYADKSSTFFSRGYLSSQKKGIGFV
jgi:argonaute-like protein implicated in RNA metabolism and viral defense